MKTEGVIIRVGQTGDFSRHTTLQGIYEMCLEDHFQTVDEQDEDALREEHERYNDDKKRKFVEDVYGYALMEPTVDLIKEWEEYYQEKWGRNR